jgi:hypothetical protein
MGFPWNPYSSRSRRLTKRSQLSDNSPEAKTTKVGGAVDA